MRVFLAALLTILALPVAAQEALSAKVGEATRIFAQNLVPGEMMDGHYFDAVTAGIDGHWVFASALMGDSTDFSVLDEKIPEICTADGPGTTRIAVTGPMTFTASRGGPNNSITVTYVYMGGAMFASQIDTTEFLTYLGLLDKDELRVPAMNSIASSTAPVSIFRPDDNILVLVRTRGATEVYARCPSENENTLDSAALATVLGTAFDEQYPKVKNPVAREAFINCVVDALAPLPASDIQMLLDTNFQPEPADMTRIGDTYPEVRDGTVACGEAADAAVGR